MLFTKIDLAKASAEKAKDQQNKIQTHPELPCHTPSKGGRAKSKGGDFTSKVGRGLRG
jgi:hypothetical protein